MDFRKQLRNSPHHDVLITCPPNWAGQTPPLYRIAVDKDSGVYSQKPLRLDPASNDREAQLGERKVRGVATQDSGSGIAFATLPVKEEPAGSSFVCCYLINRELLNYTTVWTRAPWNDHPNDEDDAQEAGLSMSLTPEQRRYSVGFVKEPPPNPTPRFLLALNTGEVLDIQLGDQKTAQISAVALKENPDVWRLLRNGCVAGVARLHGEKERLPLFSIASVHTVEPEERRGPVPTQLTGTLDFKWRPGSTIKVRFADYDPAWSYDTDRDEVIQRIATLAQTWMAEDVNIQLEFLDLAGKPSDSLTDDYDILVSLRPLLADGSTTTGGETQPEESVFFPRSLLGSYAERAERGEPTMFLGWPEGLCGPEGPITRGQYFGSETFEYIVLHEFGHALGLPHLHQHPGLNEPIFKDNEDQLARHFTMTFGVKTTREYVRHELKGRWPGPEHSEWPPLEGVAKKPGAPTVAEMAVQQDTVDHWLGESVMLGLHSRSVRNALGTLPSLGKVDRAWIRKLYPKSPRAAQPRPARLGNAPTQPTQKAKSGRTTSKKAGPRSGQRRRASGRPSRRRSRPSRSTAR